LAPWSRFSEEYKHLTEDLIVQSLAGIEMLALQPYQLAELIEKYPYIDENYPGIIALEADPIRLIWASIEQENEIKITEYSPLESPRDTEKIIMQSEPYLTQQDDSEQLPFRKMQRRFFSINEVEIEICIDCLTERQFVRHNLLWRILFNRMNPDFKHNSVIENLQRYTNINLPTIRWTGFGFEIEKVYFVEDDMETDAVLLPLEMFEDIMQYEYCKYTTSYPQENDCVKLGKWLEENAISQLLNYPS
jgi:hypothetical protein